MRVVGRVDRVELKAIVDSDLETAMSVLGIEIDPPRQRRVHYLDTPDLALHRRGVIVRARIADTGRGDDVVVKLRGRPPQIPRRPSNLAVELDALPLEVAWAASLKRRLGRGHVERAGDGSASPRPAPGDGETARLVWPSRRATNSTSTDWSSSGPSMSCG